MEYKDYNDYELLDLISEKNEDANEIIYKKYEPLVNKIANKFLKYGKNSGLELNDLKQEGMIGLAKAIDNFQNTKDATFYTYARYCIEKALISHVISSRRLKHSILNSAVSLDTTINDSNNSLDIFLKDERENPEKILLNDEYKNDLMKLANKVLSDYELQVFELKINDFTYKEIADLLDKDPKQIDNAYQRIKNKLKKELDA